MSRNVIRQLIAQENSRINVLTAQQQFTATEIANIRSTIVKRDKLRQTYYRLRQIASDARFITLKLEWVFLLEERKVGGITKLYKIQTQFTCNNNPADISTQCDWASKCLEHDLTIADSETPPYQKYISNPNYMINVSDAYRNGNKRWKKIDDVPEPQILSRIGASSLNRSQLPRNSFLSATHVLQALDLSYVDQVDAAHHVDERRIEKTVYGCATDVLFYMINHRLIAGAKKSIVVSRRDIFNQLMSIPVASSLSETVTPCVNESDEFQVDPADLVSDVIEGEDDIDLDKITGIPITAFVNFINTRRDIGVTIEFPDKTKIRCGTQYDENSHSKHFDIYCNNNHVSLLTKQPSQKVKLEEHYVECFAKADELIDQTLGRYELVLIREGCLDDIVLTSMKKLKLIPEVKNMGQLIKSVKINQTEYQLAPDYELVKKACAVLKKAFKRPFHEFMFRNQTPTALAHDIVDILLTARGLPTLPHTCEDSWPDSLIINRFKSRHAILSINSPIENVAPGASLRRHTIDISKCYYHAFLQLPNVLGIFTTRDCFEPFNETNDVQFDGEVDFRYEFIVDEFKTHGVTFPMDIWDGKSVTYLLKSNIISYNNIVMVRKPSKLVDISNHKKAITFMRKIFKDESDIFKRLYTSYYGRFGIRSVKDQHGFVSTDPEMISLGHEMRTINSTNDMYLIWKTVDSVRVSNNGNIFRAIVSGGKIDLIKLIAKIVETIPDVHLVATRVDSVAFQSSGNLPEPLLEFINTTRKGDVFAKVQNKFNPVSGNRNWELNRRGERVKIRSRESLNEILESIITGNKGLFARAGTGKTYITVQEANAVDGKKLNLATANVVKNRLKELIPDSDAFTFEAYRQKSPNLSKYAMVIIDEVSMCSDADWATIDRLVEQCYYLNIPIRICGDGNQLPSPDNLSGIYDLTTNRAIKWMFPIQTTLPFNPNARYDRELYDALEILLTEGSLRGFERRIITDQEEDGISLNICWHHDMRDVIVAKKTANGIKSDRYYFTDGYEEFSNGEFITQAQLDELDIRVRNEKRKGTNKKPKKNIRDVLESAITMTVHKAQGATFEERYAIYEALIMHLEMIYVALSRGRSMDQIYIKVDSLEEKTALLNHTFTREVRHPKIISDPVEHFENVYLIYDNHPDYGFDTTILGFEGYGPFNYVGITDRTLEERFEEHKDLERLENGDFRCGAHKPFPRSAQIKLICLTKQHRRKFKSDNPVEIYYINNLKQACLVAGVPEEYNPDCELVNKKGVVSRFAPDATLSETPKAEITTPEIIVAESAKPLNSSDMVALSMIDRWNNHQQTTHAIFIKKDNKNISARKKTKDFSIEKQMRYETLGIDVTVKKMIAFLTKWIHDNLDKTFTFLV